MSELEPWQTHAGMAALIGLVARQWTRIPQSSNGDTEWPMCLPKPCMN
jgi:hypothetical protein